jgi:hypothetical protein
MSYKVAIRKNETGEIRFSTVNWEWSDGDMYWWTEGNFGCDCNREDRWNLAGGDVPKSNKCSDSKFSALYVELPDGTKIEID